jgi:hypothetical protein
MVMMNMHRWMSSQIDIGGGGMVIKRVGRGKEIFIWYGDLMAIKCPSCGTAVGIQEAEEVGVIQSLRLANDDDLGSSTLIIFQDGQKFFGKRVEWW